MSKSLFIFSDTPFYKKNGSIYIFEPTLREIEEISVLFDKIIWMSYLRGSYPESNARQPMTSNIYPVCLPDFRGGNRWYSKLRVLLSLPLQFIYFIWWCRKAKIIHARGPSVPAMLVLLYSFLDWRRRYWYKYAGNWDEIHLPLSYRIQRFLLLSQPHKNFFITVNGIRCHMHERFLNFENPCLSDSELRRASYINKNFSGPWNICFVGNLAPFKGAVRLVQALTDPLIARKIKLVWIVGNGVEMNELLELKGRVPFEMCLTGSMSRQDIFTEVYAQSHFLILPSESEGFPKVIPEAAAHRCIPVVTDISVVSQYIHHGINGYLLKDGSSESIREILKNVIFQKSEAELSSIAEAAALLAKSFTYEKYQAKVKYHFVD